MSLNEQLTINFLYQLYKMSRSQPYRSKMSVEILRTIDVASRITLFLVGQTGPLSFTFKDRLDNKYKTSIGPEVRCTCSPGKNDHCIHTLYILLKIFKVSTQNPIIWQVAYVDSELSDLLAGKHTIAATRRPIRPVFQENDTNDELPSDFMARKNMERKVVFPTTMAERMVLNQESVCPICQEQMNNDQCLSYCGVKCGNNFHTECLKVWVSHKKNTETLITCPMCRSPQGQNFLLEIQQEQRLYKKKQSDRIRIKFKCSGCGIQDIPKNVHKCVLCTGFQLCQACYHSGKHIKHPFIRQTEEDQSRWCGAEERRESELKIKNFIDNKRKQRTTNQQLIQKLRKVEQDPAKLLDYVASAYPYVSKYISQNIDPYHKLDMDPQDMKCFKCQSKKMLFLRRLPCSHYCDHECLKQNMRKGKFYCENCGNKLFKGYENLVSREKEVQEKKQTFMAMNVSSEFNPSKMQEQPRNQYNFVLPEEATLQDILGGGGMRESQMQPDTSRIRNRFASNIVRANVQRAPSTYYPPTDSRHSRKRLSNHEPIRRREETHEANNQIRIRNVGKSTSHRSTGRQPNKRQSREDMARMLEAMIGRKVF